MAKHLKRMAALLLLVAGCSGSADPAADAGPDAGPDANCAADGGARVGIAPLRKFSFTIDCALLDDVSTDGGQSVLRTDCTQLDFAYDFVDGTALTWAVTDGVPPTGSGITEQFPDGGRCALQSDGTCTPLPPIPDAGGNYCAGHFVYVDANYTYRPYDTSPLQTYVVVQVSDYKPLPDGTRLSFSMNVPQKLTAGATLPLGSSSEGACVTAETCAQTDLRAYAEHVDSANECLHDQEYLLDDDSENQGGHELSGTLHVEAMDLRSGGHLRLTAADVGVTTFSDADRSVCSDGRIHYRPMP